MRQTLRNLKNPDGSVTAEFAILLPTIALLVIGMVQIAGLTVDRVRLVQAASVAARAASILDDATHIKKLTLAIAPGSKVAVTTDAEIVCATVSLSKLGFSLSEKICTRSQGM